MADDAQIVELLKEIRDIQKERLALQRKSLQETEAAQRASMAGLTESLTVQKRAVLFQRVAVVALALLGAFMLFLYFRQSSGSG